MRLAEEMCKPRNPSCARCPLVGTCRMGKKNAPGESGDSLLSSEEDGDSLLSSEEDGG